MTEKKDSVLKAIAAINALADSNGGFLLLEQVKEISDAMVNRFVEDDLEPPNLSLEAQRDRFWFLLDGLPAGLQDLPHGKSWSTYMFRRWVMQSPNSFAVAYRLGWKHSATNVSAKNVRRGAKGRKLIGDASRTRVRETSEKFKHLSKEAAAHEIGNLVGLSSGTVRRYLSTLFPGEEWQP